jgi:Calcineurin-like phosphoesterase
MSRILIFADSHLSPRAWDHRPIAGDSYESFRQIVDYAVDPQNQVVAVLAAGDLLDRRRNMSEPIVTLCRQLDRLQSAGIPFYYVQGQHELEASPWFGVHPHPTHVNKTVFEIAGVRLYGLDFQPADDLPGALATIPPDTHWLVCHQTWAEMLPVGTSQGQLADVPHVSVVVTGDYHVASVEPRVTTDGREMTVVSPGSTCMQDIAEPAEKTFYTYDLRSQAFEAWQLVTRRVLRLNVLAAEELPDAVLRVTQLLAEVNELPEAIRKPIVRITCPAAIADLVVSRMLSVFEGSVHFFWRQTSDDAQTAAEIDVENATTLLAGLQPYLRDTDQLDLEADARALLTAADPAEAVAALVDQCTSKN